MIIVNEREVRLMEFICWYDDYCIYYFGSATNAPKSCPFDVDTFENMIELNSFVNNLIQEGLTILEN